MKKPFHPLSVQTYTHHYGGVLPHYSSFQEGDGLGGLLRRLFTPLMPIIKQQAKIIGKKALKSGLNLGKDILEGQNVKQAGKQRLKEFATDVFSHSGAERKRKRKVDVVLRVSKFKRYSGK